MRNARTKPRGSLLRQLSEREVLTALQGHGPLSRAEIARHTKISGPTVTRTVSALLEAGLLEEGDARQQALGRPGRVLRLATKTVSVLGAVVGAKRCELVSAGLDGQIHADLVRHFATPARYGDLVNVLVRHARQLMEEHPARVHGLGISMPGLLNRRERRTVFSPNLHQTDGQQLGEDMKKRLGLETAILQESHALCLAEMTYGAARDVADFAMLDISEGLGVGVVHGGHILEGHSGLGGELGHITVDIHGKPCGCGNRGCLETVATDTALASALSARLERKLTIEEVIALLRSGDVKADEEFAQVLEYLAVGLAAVINLFNPSKLFVHGRLLDAAPNLFEQLLERTRRRALAPSMADCDIIRARGNKRLGAIAGIIHRLTTGREEPLETL
ncbi:MAG TPA: ROK family transcriptional regulator [Gemmataceae bacterium]|nr:ROK family transcriptional regulator [Gemmataceae bacterium]